MIALQEQKNLVQAALRARQQAYAPYSGFLVGAALLTKSKNIYTGCNIEFISYSPTNCAERTAVFKAVSEGETAFAAIAIVGGKQGEPVTQYCPPCGVCRQVLAEFCTPDFPILLGVEEGDIQMYTLKDLLLVPFSPVVLMEEDSK